MKMLMIMAAMLILQITVLGQHVRQQDLACKGLKGTMVDLDTVRSRYLEQIEYAYGRGCRYGTDYPPEFREAVGFNPNSPSNYCNESYRAQMLDYSMSMVVELTR